VVISDIGFALVLSDAEANSLPCPSAMSVAFAFFVGVVASSTAANAFDNTCVFNAAAGLSILHIASVVVGSDVLLGALSSLVESVAALSAVFASHATSCDTAIFLAVFSTDKFVPDSLNKIIVVNLSFLLSKNLNLCTFITCFPR